MPSNVTEGETYLVRLSVTNNSTNQGVPMEADLGIGISAASDLISILPSQVSVQHFAAGETREFGYSMHLPTGMAGQTVTIDGWVEDPSGNTIVSATTEAVIVSGTITPGWVVDDKSVFQTWWALVGATWGNIFREEYVASVKSNIPAIPEEELYIGYTWVNQITPIYYQVWTITYYDASRGIWLCDVEKHWIGLDSIEGREYWKTQIPTGVPVSFAFYKGEVPEDALRELESSGAADVTNIGLIYWSVNWQLCFKAIIYDLDGFFDILRKYKWFNMAGRLLG